MKSLNFEPVKSTEEFRKNYRLHDLAEYHGKNLFMQWGIDFTDYGKDKRFERVWEKGADKPDIVAEYESIKFLVDWKGKSKRDFWVNKRALDSYNNWSSKLKLEVIICFFIFNKKNQLLDRRFALLSKHNSNLVEKDAWDKNKIISFGKDLPEFNKFNLTNLLKSA